MSKPSASQDRDGRIQRRGRQETDPQILRLEEALRLSIADAIDALCAAHGWTQTEAAQAAGLKAATFGDILRARRRTDIPSLVRVAEAFGCCVVIRFEPTIKSIVHAPRCGSNAKIGR
jgi:Helix-turn-helix domain